MIAASATYRQILSRLLGWSPAVLLAIVVIVGIIINPALISGANLAAVASQSIPIFLIALAAGLVLISGSIDLSAGLTVALVSVVVGFGLNLGWPSVPALLLGLAAATAVGFWNGLIAGFVRLPAFVATLATAIALQGINIFLSPGIIIIKDPVLKALGRGAVLGFPFLYIVAAIAALTAYLLLHQSRFGLKTYAVGSSRENAVLAGLAVERHQFMVFIASSVICFVASVVMISRTLVVTPNVGGMPLLLDGIAAAVIGGTSIFGGKGTVFGIACGALIIGLVTHLLRTTGVDPSSLDLFKGLLIAFALLLEVGLAAMRSYLKTV
ncbi:MULTISPECIES: ABC transporter permease [unclassified Mesorhizobium]|uniref:ABC transporter permease n=1 Tax=unclassified Mesorhizobium TaxID=325217 RepID=UPI002415022A|nr:MULTISPECIES: ABC transporter permease [unclassified Mesorhizobium]MDG4889886.1 ABC transporter permease [Mesorhizobium sp. WSM4887]MDG4904029.1 ABC transporter permease [Mesorhizobium sp. WSM4962]MDG4909056.1 ABC transporter permease [Mesorhizobium sp. WSM4898]MDG4921680.1 ABC transporter permease [Mesorhizobium sp. WSM4989]